MLRPRWRVLHRARRLASEIAWPALLGLRRDAGETLLLLRARGFSLIERIEEPAASAGACTPDRGHG